MSSNHLGLRSVRKSLVARCVCVGIDIIDYVTEIGNGRVFAYNPCRSGNATFDHALHYKCKFAMSNIAKSLVLREVL